MKKILFVLVLAFSSYSFADKLAGTVLVGYNNGLGVEGALKIGQFAEGFPFHMRLGLGYAAVSDPGKAWNARRIFINDNTNGDPEKSGHFLEFSFDLMYQVRWLGMKEGFLYFGPRYSSFNGNFKFIGGNEFFDIESDQWGIATGLIAYFPISAKLKLVTNGGLAYYFKSTLAGHDTAYSPDGEHINPRNDYEYKDADDAIYQPYFNFRLMIGLSYQFK